MGLLALASTGLVLTTTWGGNTYDWDSPRSSASSRALVVAAVAFVLVERRAAEPIMPLHLFKQSNFILTTIAGSIIGIAMFGAIAYLPTYLQMVTGVERDPGGPPADPADGGPARHLDRLRSVRLARPVATSSCPSSEPIITAGALALLSHHDADHAGLASSALYLAIMGIGLGHAPCRSSS